MGSCGGLLRRRRSLKVLSTTLGRFRGRARARAMFHGGDRGVGQPVAVADRPGGGEVDGRAGGRGGEGGGRGVGREEGAWGGARRRREGREVDGGASGEGVEWGGMEKWPEPARGLSILRPVCRVSARYDTRQRF